MSGPPKTDRESFKLDSNPGYLCAYEKCEKNKWAKMRLTRTLALEKEIG